MGGFEKRAPFGRAVWTCGYGRLAALLLLTGCSLINDSGEQQCTVNTDCFARFGKNDLAISCVNNYCDRAPCNTDDDCKNRDGDIYASSICGADKFCIAPTTAACTTVADCESESPTMQCVQGRCEDKVWGCRDQLDDRATAMLPTASFQGRVYDLITRQPVPNLTAKACLLPTFDPDCATPLASTNSTYELATGTLTVSGLPQDTPVRLKLDFPPELQLVPIDLYSTRTPRDLTRFALVTTMPTALVPQLTQAIDPRPVVDPANASISAIVLDCENQPAKGVTLVIPETDRLPGTQVVYFGADGQPAPQATGTDAFGSALILNVKPRKLITLQAKVGNMLVKEYRVMGIPDRSTVVHFFPRLYRDQTASGG